MATIARLTDKQSQDFANKIGDIFKSVPHLPKEWVAFLVKIAPVMALIGAVLSLFAGPLMGVLGVLTLLTLNPLLVLSVFLSAILSVASAVLLFLAYKPLQARAYEGWMYLFWSEVIGAASTLVMILFGRGGIGGIVGIAIGFYILFEMRSSYQGVVGALKAEVKKMES